MPSETTPTRFSYPYLNRVLTNIEVAMSAHQIPAAINTATAASITLLKGGLVIDGTGSAPQPNTDVLLVDKQIAAVGKNLQLDADVLSKATIVDCSKFTVMPGLIDAYAHAGHGMI